MNGNLLDVLLIEDIPVYVSLLKRMLISSQIAIDAAGSLKDGLEKAEHSIYSAVLLDLNLPDSQGIRTFLAFQSRFPGIPIIILTGLDDEQLAAKAVQLGAQDYLIKGSYLIKGEAGKNLLIRSIQYAIERQHIQAALLQERNLLEVRVAERTSELQRTNELLGLELAERKRYEFIVNTSKDLLSLIDRNYCYQAVNDEYCTAQNIKRQDIIGKTVAEVWGQIVFETLIKPQIEQGFNRVESKYEGWFNFKTLGYRYFEVSYYPYVTPQNEVTHVVVVSRDETTRENARERLRQHNYRLNILREIDNATLAARSPQDIIRVALKHFWRLVPYDRVDVLLFSAESSPIILITGNIQGEVTTKKVRFHVKDLLRKESFKNGRSQVANDLRQETRLSSYEKHLQGAGIRSSLIISLYAEGKMIGLLSLNSTEPHIYKEEHIESAKDMSIPFALMVQNSRLFEQVRAINEHLRSLTARLVSAQEDERRKISIELHDETGQSLTALKLSLALIRSELPDGLDCHRQSIQEAINLTEETMDQLRSLAHNLRPPALDAVGLNQTLRDYCQRIAKQAGIPVDYYGSQACKLPSHIQISIYRVLQEAMTNVIKHAHAGRVEVSLENDAEMVSFRIEDNGCGFLRQAGCINSSVQGIGLIGIRERIDALGGILDIDTAPGQGTRIIARIPVSEEK